jgi:hypothetical protein
MSVLHLKPQFTQMLMVGCYMGSEDGTTATRVALDLYIRVFFFF